MGSEMCIRDSNKAENIVDETDAKYIEFERCNEDNDIEGVVKKLESEKYEVRYATALTELDGGQKLVRFYDPSGNLIEIRTPWDKFGNRE